MSSFQITNTDYNEEMANSLYMSSIYLNEIIETECEVSKLSDKNVTVTLKKLLSIYPDSNISQPIVVAKSVIAPNDDSESIFVCTQPGQIWKIYNGLSSKILDISFVTGNPQLVKELGTPGFYIPDYDERGLLGIAFDKYFSTNGIFFLYYTSKDNISNVEFPDVSTPCNPDLSEWDENIYSHMNVLDIWNYNNGNPFQVKRLLSIKNPYFNHDSLDNLYYDDIEDKLVFFTGDGGFRDGPFKLSQKDDYFHGKCMLIDTKSLSWKSYNSVPIARLSELPNNITPLIKTVIKGVRNWSGIGSMPITNSNQQNIKFMGQPGQDTVESVWAFKNYTKNSEIRNIGWPAWEGDLPSLQNLICGTGEFTKFLTNFKNMTFYQDAINLAIDREHPYIQYYHQDSRPDALQGIVIVGQQPYLGNAIPDLTNQLIITDWGTNSGLGQEAFPNGLPINGGQIMRVPIDNCLSELHEYKKISINYDFKQEYNSKYPIYDDYPIPFFLGLSSSINKDKLYLLTYNRVGSAEKDIGLGVIYEIIKA